MNQIPMIEKFKSRVLKKPPSLAGQKTLLAHRQMENALGPRGFDNQAIIVKKFSHVALILDICCLAT